MSFIWQTLKNAVLLLFPPSFEVWTIIGTSLILIGISLAIALVVGIPLGALLAFKVFPGKKQTQTLVQASIGFPPVIIGLFVSLLFWEGKGPLGYFKILQTPLGLIVTYIIIVLPIIVGFTMAGIRQIKPQLITQFLALGASPTQLLGLVLWEIRYTFIGAVLVGCSRLFSEVGASLMVGGNLPYSTQVIATAITAETTQGNLELAVALALVLLVLVIITSLVFAFIPKGRPSYEYSR